MIDISMEKVMGFGEAIDHLPRRRAGKKCNISTFYRWSQIGVRGIRLETISIGGTKCTSVEAMQRFFDELTADQAGESPKPSKSRKKQIEAAERRLEQAGV